MIKLSPTQTRLISALALLMMLAGACSQQETAKTLARRLSEADRVTIADYPRRLFTMPLTAEEAKRCIQAVSTAKKAHPFITSTPELSYQYFKGTNLLGEFRGGANGAIFWIDHGPDPDHPGLRQGTPYKDSTGTLEMLVKKLRDEAATRGIAN